MNRSLLYVTVLIIATCGLVYELIVGTLASYLLGDSITQFSTVIGVYLFALGIGAWISGFIDKGVAQRFVEIELAVALAGGISAPFLFATFASGASFRIALYGMVLVIGTLVGLEIPLLMRLMKEQLQFKDLVCSSLLVSDDTSSTNGWMQMPTHAGVYNLLGLQNGVDTLLATLVVPQDVIKEIRFVLGPNNSVKDLSGAVFPLTIPSGEESGLKIKVNKKLSASLETLLIDFDAALSVYQTGTGAYKLKPVLKIK